MWKQPFGNRYRDAMGECPEVERSTIALDQAVAQRHNYNASQIGNAKAIHTQCDHQNVTKNPMDTKKGLEAVCSKSLLLKELVERMLLES